MSNINLSPHNPVGNGNKNNGKGALTGPFPFKVTGGATSPGGVAGLLGYFRNLKNVKTLIPLGGGAAGLVLTGLLGSGVFEKARQDLPAGYDIAGAMRAGAGWTSTSDELSPGFGIDGEGVRAEFTGITPDEFIKSSKLISEGAKAAAAVGEGGTASEGVYRDSYGGAGSAFSDAAKKGAETTAGGVAAAAAKPLAIREGLSSGGGSSGASASYVGATPVSKPSRGGSHGASVPKDRPITNPVHRTGLGSKTLGSGTTASSALAAQFKTISGKPFGEGGEIKPATSATAQLKEAVAGSTAKIAALPGGGSPVLLRGGKSTVQTATPTLSLKQQQALEDYKTAVGLKNDQKKEKIKNGNWLGDTGRELAKGSLGKFNDWAQAAVQDVLDPSPPTPKWFCVDKNTKQVITGPVKAAKGSPEYTAFAAACGSNIMTEDPDGAIQMLQSGGSPSSGTTTGSASGTPATGSGGGTTPAAPGGGGAPGGGSPMNIIAPNVSIGGGGQQSIQPTQVGNTPALLAPQRGMASTSKIPQTPAEFNTVYENALDAVTLALQEIGSLGQPAPGAQPPVTPQKVADAITEVRRIVNEELLTALEGLSSSYRKTLSDAVLPADAAVADIGKMSSYDTNPIKTAITDAKSELEKIEKYCFANQKDLNCQRFFDNMRTELGKINAEPPMPYTAKPYIVSVASPVVILMASDYSSHRLARIDAAVAMFDNIVKDANGIHNELNRIKTAADSWLESASKNAANEKQALLARGNTFADVNAAETELNALKETLETGQRIIGTFAENPTMSQDAENLIQSQLGNKIVWLAPDNDTTYVHGFAVAAYGGEQADFDNVETTFNSLSNNYAVQSFTGPAGNLFSGKASPSVFGVMLLSDFMSSTIATTAKGRYNNIKGIIDITNDEIRVIDAVIKSYHLSVNGQGGAQSVPTGNIPPDTSGFGQSSSGDLKSQDPSLLVNNTTGGKNSAQSKAWTAEDERTLDEIKELLDTKIPQEEAPVIAKNSQQPQQTEPRKTAIAAPESQETVAQVRETSSNSGENVVPSLATDVDTPLASAQTKVAAPSATNSGGDGRVKSSAPTATDADKPREGFVARVEDTFKKVLAKLRITGAGDNADQLSEKKIAVADENKPASTGNATLASNQTLEQRQQKEYEQAQQLLKLRQQELDLERQKFDAEQAAKRDAQWQTNVKLMQEERNKTSPSQNFVANRPSSGVSGGTTGTFAKTGGTSAIGAPLLANNVKADSSSVKTPSVKSGNDNKVAKQPVVLAKVNKGDVKQKPVVAKVPPASSSGCAGWARQEQTMRKQIYATKKSVIFARQKYDAAVSAEKEATSGITGFFTSIFNKGKIDKLSNTVKSAEAVLAKNTRDLNNVEAKLEMLQSAMANAQCPA